MPTYVTSLNIIVGHGSRRGWLMPLPIKKTGGRISVEKEVVAKG